MPNEKNTKAQISALKAGKLAFDEMEYSRRKGLATQEEALKLELKFAEAVLASKIAFGELGTALDAERDKIVSLKANLEAATTAQNRLNDQLAAAEGLVDSLADSLFGLDQSTSKFFGVMEGGTETLSKAASKFQKTFLSTNLLKLGTQRLVMGIKDLIKANISFALQQDEVIANFRASTGAGAEFNEVIRQTERDIYLAGGSFAEAASATGELKNTFTDFTYLNTEMQGELAATTFHLSKLGLSQGTTAGIMQTSTQAMGMSVDQATGFLTDMASTARSLGMDTDKLGQAFLQNKDFFVRFGKDGQQVFEDLAVASKALGAEVGLLVKVMEGFETFDGAATSVGRLNAILGGPFLNSIDMMNASFEDPIEGIKQLRDGFDAAGVSVEDLSGAELKAFSSALGLSTSETKELLGESNEQLDLMKMNQDDLAAAAREAMPIINQLKSVFFALMADFKPLIDSVLIPVAGWLGKMAQGLGKFLEKNEGLISFAAALGAVGAAAIAIMSPLGWVGGAIATIVGLAGGLGVGGLGVSARNANPAVSKSVLPRFATGGVVTGTTTAIVGENGPEMVEMPTGSRVTTAPATKQLTDAIMKLSNKLDNVGGGENIQLAVYIGKEKVDEIVVNAINSRAGRAAFSPFSNA